MTLFRHLAIFLVTLLTTSFFKFEKDFWCFLKFFLFDDKTRIILMSEQMVQSCERDDNDDKPNLGFRHWLMLIEKVLDIFLIKITAQTRENNFKRISLRLKFEVPHCFAKHSWLHAEANGGQRRPKGRRDSYPSHPTTTWHSLYLCSASMKSLYVVLLRRACMKYFYVELVWSTFM